LTVPDLRFLALCLPGDHPVGPGPPPWRPPAGRSHPARLRLARGLGVPDQL